MQKLSEKEIIRRIKRQETFSAIIDSEGFSIKIDRYVPAICTAIHAGHNIPPHINNKLLLDADARRLEEAPYSGDMLASFPIVLQGLDSQYHYDLNRPAEDCIYDEALDTKVWRRPLTKKECDTATSLHNSYYRVLHALLTRLEKSFSRCIVYDLNTYTYQRLAPDTPLFNIGTHFIDSKVYQPVLTHLKKRLETAQLPNIMNRVAFDEVFSGRGHQASFIHTQHRQSLCIPLEIKKVYMDEGTGEPYPFILEAITESLKQAISYNAAYFSRKFGRKRLQRSTFFAEESSRLIKKIDTALFRVAKGVDTLRYINPVNLAQERKTFFSKQGNYTPQFHYRQLKIDPFVFREKLYAIPVDNIQDVSIRQLYRSTIDALAQKIDLLTTIGTDHFLYNSLRFHGEPRESDIALARFLIAAPPIEDENTQEYLSPEACREVFQLATEEYGFDCGVELSSRIVARVMVSSGRRKVLINRGARFTATEIQGLIHHELGIHMVTTLNADQQSLKIFKLGLPGNTETQEGLAILSEHLSGNLTLSRLQSLAHRVMAVHMMVQNYDFPRTYASLREDFGLSQDDAFNLTVRVYRGGGFTKDALYLKGLERILSYLQKFNWIKGIEVQTT